MKDKLKICATSGGKSQKDWLCKVASPPSDRLARGMEDFRE